MEILLWVIAGAYLFAVTWVLYLAVMNIKRNKDKLTKVAKCIAYPVAFIGVITDVFFNITLGSLYFIELPREWLFTSRLQRHIKRSKGKRLRKAEWFCHHLLDPFDPKGYHCVDTQNKI